MEYPKFKVCVCCMTFNQSKYIEDAMNGFTMQQTDFPFVCCIVDDASTDGEQHVIKEYLNENFSLKNKEVTFEKETDYANIIYAQHKTNKNCYFSVLLLKENLYSKNKGKEKLKYISEWRDLCEYEALCEGDDYWIVPNKLQKQVDFLESHPDYGLVHTNFRIFNEALKKLEYNGSKKYHIVNGEVFNELFKGCFIRTLTVLYRTSLFPVLNTEQLNNGMFLGDMFLFFEVSLHSKIHFINEETSVYRLLQDSASHSPNPEKRLAFYKSLEALDNYYIASQHIDGYIRLNVERKWFIQYLKHYIIIGDYKGFKSLHNNKYLSILQTPILYFIYVLGQHKITFNLLSRIWKYKLVLKF